MRASVATPPVSRTRAWFTLVLFLLLYVCSMVDRSIVNVLVEPVRREFGIGASEIGLLLGPAFGVSYVALALPLAWLADRWSRRGVVFICILVWSLSNCAAAFSQSFGMLLATRVGVGAGEAALVPAAYVLIAQLFPRKRLAFALSIFSMGGTGGTAISFAAGGWLLDALHGGRALPLIGHLESWRLVFFLTGLPSLVLGLLLWFVPERTGPASSDIDRDAKLLPFLREHPWPTIGIPLAFGMAMLSSSALVAWLPTYMMPTFGWSASHTGAVLGVMFVGVVSVGKLVSGVATDAMFERGIRDAHPRYLMWCMIAAVPLGLAAFSLSAAPPFVALIGAWFLLAYPLQAYGSAAIQIITPESLRARMSAVFIVLINLMATFGPTIVGIQAEHVFGSSSAIGPALILTIAIWGPLTILVLLALLKPTRRAVMAAERAKLTSEMIAMK